MADKRQKISKLPTGRLKPFKFIVQAVLLEENGRGEVTGERSTEPVVFYSADHLKDWAADFDQVLLKAMKTDTHLSQGKPDQPNTVV